jgi:hypothetical protein
MNAPVIQSIGPPPERHADRVVAEMLRWLKAEGDRLMVRVDAMLAAEGPPPGSPRAQQRFAMRLAKAADQLLLGIWLKPGKRGKFKLFMSVWGVLAEGTDKPQVVLGTFVFDSLGHYRVEPHYKRLFIVSHHALSRLAQRCEVRTVQDLHQALALMGDAAMSAGWEFLHADDYPPAGKRFAFDGGIAVLKRDADSGDLVIATILESKEEEETTRHDQ